MRAQGFEKVAEFGWEGREVAGSPWRAWLYRNPRKMEFKEESDCKVEGRRFAAWP